MTLKSRVLAAAEFDYKGFGDWSENGAVPEADLEVLPAYYMVEKLRPLLEALADLVGQMESECVCEKMMPRVRAERSCYVCEKLAKLREVIK